MSLTARQMIQDHHDRLMNEVVDLEYHVANNPNDEKRRLELEHKRGILTGLVIALGYVDKAER